MKNYKFPIYGFFGIGLVIISWYLNWSLTGLRTHIGFFPLWFGYSIFIDALVYKRKGSSLIRRGLRNYVFLFIISAPVWWLFELFNSVTQNWHYAGREFFTDFEYFLLASLSFSTVIPAVFGTSELVSTFSWVQHIKLKLTLTDSNKLRKIFTSVGIMLIILIMLLPGYFFPFVWISIYFIVEPINLRLGYKSLLNYTKDADWRPLISLVVGVLICGFLWEMWNYFSYPKWIYTVPFVDFLYVFEMPLLGFIGYPPFALELYAVYNLLIGWLTKSNNYLQLGIY